MSIQELRTEAKLLGINSFGMKAEEIRREIEKKKHFTGVSEKEPMVISADADKRAEEIRQMRLRGGVEMGAMPLTLEVKNKEQGYEYRWVMNRAARIEAMKNLGWEIDTKYPPRSAGKNSTEKLVLMKIPSAIYSEDQKRKANELLETEEGLKRGQAKTGERVEESRVYGEVKVGRS